MADPLYDLLVPYLEDSTEGASSRPNIVATSYISSLTKSSLASLSTEEPQSLAQLESSNLLALQALSSRSHKSVIASSNALSSLEDYIPTLTSSARGLHDAIPDLDDRVIGFAKKYSRSNAENTVLDRRKRATLVSQNIDRLTDILELPFLLSSAISSSAAPAGSSSGVNYSQALDLFAHIKRLDILHPQSTLVKSILSEAESVMKNMTSNLISSLRAQNIRLAAAIRTIGWLRRVAPDLGNGLPPGFSKPSFGSLNSASDSISDKGTESFGYLFLVCRLYNLINMLEALIPLRDLADQETQQRFQKERQAAHFSVADNMISPKKAPIASPHSLYTGQQTERYLKRYVEIFREQSFATVSMYKNIFPETDSTSLQNHESLLTVPSPLLTFPSHLISLLCETLKAYLPNLTDQSARDAIFMQVLYAAGSLGRLGADFSLIIADLCSDDSEPDDENIPDLAGEPRSDQAGEEARSDRKISRGAEVESEPGPKDQDHVPEWIRILKKHRVQSSKLEALSSSAPMPSTPLSTSQGHDLPLRR